MSDYVDKITEKNDEIDRLREGVQAIADATKDAKIWGLARAILEGLDTR